MKKKIKILILSIFLISMSSCQSIKDGLSGNKSENSDEFLVQKKNPLVLPPKYLELPKPKDYANDEVDETDDIENILGLDNESENTTIESAGSAEEFVLKNINNN